MLVKDALLESEVLDIIKIIMDALNEQNKINNEVESRLVTLEQKDI